MTMPISFIVPGRPTGKKRPRFARNGGHVRTYQPKEDKEREALIAACYMREAMASSQMLKPYEGGIVIEITSVFMPPTSWSKAQRADPGPMLSKPDADNIAKSVLDALNGIAWRDDKQIVDIRSRKQWGEHDGLVVIIKEI